MHMHVLDSCYVVNHEGWHTWHSWQMRHDACIGFNNTLSIMMTATHGTTAHQHGWHSVMMRVLVGLFKIFVNHEGHQGMMWVLASWKLLTFMMAATHGTAGTAFLEHLVNHDGWHTQHVRHNGTIWVLASPTILSIMRAATHGTAGTVTRMGVGFFMTLSIMRAGTHSIASTAAQCRQS